jgi:hypothetical protein
MVMTRTGYQVILDARGIICSMSRRGDCYDCHGELLDRDERAR